MMPSRSRFLIQESTGSDNSEAKVSLDNFYRLNSQMRMRRERFLVTGILHGSRRPCLTQQKFSNSNRRPWMAGQSPGGPEGLRGYVGHSLRSSVLVKAQLKYSFVPDLQAMIHASGITAAHSSRSRYVCYTVAAANR